jgi:hypothetical protein
MRPSAWRGGHASRQVTTRVTGCSAISISVTTGQDGHSFVSTHVEGGRPYFIVVDGYDGQAGRFHLRVTAPVAREQCSSTCTCSCKQVQCPRNKKNRKRCLRRCTKRAMPICASEGQCF